MNNNEPFNFIETGWEEEKKGSRKITRKSRNAKHKLLEAREKQILREIARKVIIHAIK